jgi:hypothetical protein
MQASGKSTVAVMKVRVGIEKARLGKTTTRKDGEEVQAKEG